MRLFFFILFLIGTIDSSSAQFKIKATKYISSPSASVISDDGKYFYLRNGKGVGVYRINPTTKLLENIQELKISGSSSELLLTKDNRFVITTNFSDGVLLIYKRDPSNGKLSLHKKYEQTIDGKGSINKPMDIALSPSGRYLFLAGNKTLMTLRFQDGTATYLRQHDSKGSPHGTIYFSTDGEYAFIAYYGDNSYFGRTILKFNDETGELYVVGDLREDYPIPGSYYYFGRKQKQYTVSANLEYMNFSPDGKDVYMDGTESYSNGGRGAIMHYRWVNGKLVLQNAYYELAVKYQLENIKNICLDGSGGYLYVLTGGDDSGIHIFKRDAHTGALTFIQTFHKKNYPQIATPYRASFSADNKYIYVSNYFGGNVVVLENSNAKPSPRQQQQLNVDNKETPQPIVQDIPTNNVSDHDCPYTSITEVEMKRIENQLNGLETEQARYDFAMKTVQNRCLKTMQVLKLARVFEVEYIRLEWVKFAYYYTSDIENFYLLDTLFTNKRLKQAFKASLEG
ncbi:beta-propeller fold lactonase family protein [Aureispira sp. CCB-QB1]|uniref:beta-propeller fold lactonase family protein n=1 Tax=Aureispira sp. CCB-QB1 TaxID=1313421 RepID=UPI000697DB03|nr:beta-propeller fold lactonase family protein [Aureispira sp. CCB-QB1]